MNIEDMTTEQIEKYLAERKALREGELGGILKRADEVQRGETAWLKCAKRATGNIATLFAYEFEDGSDDIRIYNQALVETDVPERAPARRRMTAADAEEHLQVGQEVWVKCRIASADAADQRHPVRVDFDYLGSHCWLLADTEIEVDA